MLRSNNNQNSESEEPSEEALLEAELSSLQRSYRVMQNDFKAYKEETKRIINKQNMLISGLDKEHQELNTIRARMETSQNRGKDEWSMQQLSQLSLQEKDYKHLIQEEQDMMKQLDTEILEMEKQICEQRKEMGGVHNSTMKHMTTQKKMSVLENRLDKAMVHFNQQLAVNYQLREEIDHFRRERSVFENLHKKLSKELDGCKGEIAEVIEGSTQAFEQRDEAHTKIQALKERTEKDQQQHEAEMKDLQRFVTHDDRIKEFMKIKASDRAELKAEEAAKKQAAGANKGLDSDQTAVLTYEAAFKRIRQVTGKQDLYEIVHSFIQKEEKNFALFNYVTELNSQVEVLQDEVVAIKQDISVFQAEDALVDEQRKDLLKEMEVKYSKMQKETSRSEERLKEVNKVLDELKTSIEALFHRVDCDIRPIQEMLGGVGISNKNVMMYLGQIEQRTTEFLRLLHFIKLQKLDLEGRLPRKTEPHFPVPPIQQQLYILPPSTEDEEDLEGEEEEDEPRPLTEAELRDKVRQNLDRRAASVSQPITPPKGGATPKENKKRKTTKS